VNLGIGMPEGVASVAAEEGMLDFVTLSTEPGSFGGLPASGKSFGPAFNASALVEMNQMFDFYDGVSKSCWISCFYYSCLENS
jgi:propionate CoA-transferase